MIAIKLKDTYSMNPDMEGTDTVFRIPGDTLYVITAKDYDQFCNLLDVSKDDFKNAFVSMFTDLKLDYNLNSLIGIVEQTYNIKLSSEYVFILAFICECAYGITYDEETKKLIDVDYKEFIFKLIVPLKEEIADIEFQFPTSTTDGGVASLKCEFKDLEKICVPAIDSKVVVFFLNKKFYFVSNTEQLQSNFSKKGTVGGYFTGDIDFMKEHLVDILKLLPLNVPIKIDSIRDLMNIRFKDMLLDIDNGGGGLEKLDDGIKLSDEEFIAILQSLKADIVGGTPDGQEDPSPYDNVKVLNITIDPITLDYLITIYVDANDPYTIIKEQ